MIKQIGNTRKDRKNESGNLLFFILIAIVLIGTLSAVITNSSDTESANIDSESSAILITQIQRQASEFERGVQYILQNGFSESAVRFSHPNAPADYDDITLDADIRDQLFTSEGGGVTYREPPARVNDGSPWEFYGNSVIPSVGSSEPDLIAVLPNLNRQLCSAINAKLGQQDEVNDSGTCINTGAALRFSNSVQFNGAQNAIAGADFAQDPVSGQARPALQACVICDDKTAHYYHVLLAR